MRPVMPPEDAGGAEVVIAKDQPEYRQLPARTDGMTVVTYWELTKNERAMIAAGERLVLQITTFGFPLQPMHLAVEGQDDADELIASATPCDAINQGVECMYPRGHAGRHRGYVFHAEKLEWQTYEAHDGNDRGVAHG